MIKMTIDGARLLSYVIKGNDRVTYKTELEVPLKELLVQNKTKYHKSDDVAVVQIGDLEKLQDGTMQTKYVDGIKKISGGNILGADKNGIKKFDDVLVGNSIFSFGYPTSVSKIPPLDIKMPLLRKGIVAGKNELVKLIILDCFEYPGNSGGLVIEVEEKKSLGKKNYMGVGVVSSLTQYVKSKKAEDFENSGYSVAVPMDRVLEVLQEFGK